MIVDSVLTVRKLEREITFSSGDDGGDYGRLALPNIASFEDSNRVVQVVQLVLELNDRLRGIPLAPQQAVHQLHVDALVFRHSSRCAVEQYSLAFAHLLLRVDMRVFGPELFRLLPAALHGPMLGQFVVGDVEGARVATETRSGGTRYLCCSRSLGTR